VDLGVEELSLLSTAAVVIKEYMTGILHEDGSIEVWRSLLASYSPPDFLLCWKCHSPEKQMIFRLVCLMLVCRAMVGLGTDSDFFSWTAAGGVIAVGMLSDM
jgi:hypothetical protein